MTPRTTTLAMRAVEKHCPAEDRELVLDMLGLTPPAAPGEPGGPRIGPMRHGTVTGARAHRRRGERPCATCGVAERAYAELRRRAAGIPQRCRGPINHGTANGARVHRKRREKPCAACLEADRLDVQRRRERSAS